MPLAVGNEWHYDVVFPSDTTQTASHRPARRPRIGGRVSTAQTSGEDVVTITNTLISGGSTWYVADRAYVGASGFVTSYLRHDSNGLLVRSGVSDPGYYALRAPLSVGSSWVDQFNPAHTFRIIGVGEQVSTTAGLFRNCIVVEDTIIALGEPDDVLTTWFAEDVGTVKEINYVGSNLYFTSELISYSLWTD
jgi:hypothetical protein